jgi:hypothetical protein
MFLRIFAGWMLVANGSNFDQYAYVELTFFLAALNPSYIEYIY